LPIVVTAVHDFIGDSVGCLWHPTVVVDAENRPSTDLDWISQNPH